MNRRDFFKALGAVAVAPAIPTLSVLLPQPGEVGARYAQALARSMTETKETLTANILNRAFVEEPLQYRVQQRYAAAYADWRGIFGSVGA